MNIKIKPIIKQALPTLSIAGLTFSTALANQNKTDSIDFNNIEYLQADKYERQGTERIEAGLTRQEAYKDEALKTKFDIANIDNDSYINETEATIYNWSKDKSSSFDGDMVQSGLVLNGVDRTIVLPNHEYPSFYIYPNQKEETLKYPVEKRLFRATDKNIDGILSPTEVLRYIKSQEFEYFDTQIKDLDSQILKAQEKRDIKNINLPKKLIPNAIYSLLLGLGIFLAAGENDNKYGIKKLIASAAIALLTFLMVGGTKGAVTIKQNNEKWSNLEQEAMCKKEELSPLRDKKAKELNHLDEQLKIEELNTLINSLIH